MRRICKVIFWAFLIFAGSCLAYNAVAINVLASALHNHTTGNVPAEEDFSAFLDRDLNTYFRAKFNSDVTVAYEMLRQGPTQSGVAYPKYFLWVDVTGPDLKDTGAVRLAAIQKEYFEITRFTPALAICEGTGSIATIFPRALLPAIWDKAARACINN